MGYITEYELTIHGENPEIHNDQILERLKEISDHNLTYMVESKWYNHDKHMIQLSEEYPNHFFELEGKGGEQPDLWKKYYKNGKSKHITPKIIWENVNENDL